MYFFTFTELVQSGLAIDWIPTYMKWMDIIQ